MFPLASEFHMMAALLQGHVVIERTRAEGGKVGEVRCVGAEHAPLVIVLVIGEEEEAVLLDRPAEPEAGLASRKERIRAGGIALQSGISRYVVIAKVEESRA